MPIAGAHVSPWWSRRRAPARAPRRRSHDRDPHHRDVGPQRAESNVIRALGPGTAPPRADQRLPGPGAYSGAWSISGAYKDGVALVAEGQTRTFPAGGVDLPVFRRRLQARGFNPQSSRPRTRTQHRNPDDATLMGPRDSGRERAGVDELGLSASL